MPENEMTFKCGGLLGSLLELNRLCRSKTDAELKELDEKWYAMCHNGIEMPDVTEEA